MIRVLMMGTGGFAVPVFEAFWAADPFQVVGLVTRPLAAAVRTHGKLRQPLTPMRIAAARVGGENGEFPIFDPLNVNTPESMARLREFNADLYIVCDYGQILSAEVLAIPRYGCLNLHGSLLPKYRGASPVSWAIYHGETVTGVSVIRMTPQLDAGGVIARAELTIGPNETTEQLEPRLAQLGAPLVLQAVDSLIAGRTEVLPQDPSLVTKAPRLKRESGIVDWNRTAEQILNHWRSMEPWPRSSTWWLRESEPLRVILTKIEIVPEDEVTIPNGTEPGTILESRRDQFIVATGNGAIRIGEIQPAGKKPLPAEGFINGYRPIPGQRFGRVE